MISSFGIISLVASLISVCVLIFIYKILRRRNNLDEAYTQLDNTARNQLEAIFEAAETLPNCEEIRDNCETLSSYETRLLVKSLPKLRKSAPETENLSQAVSQTELAADNLNQKIDEYNAFSQTFPAKLMLPILGLAQEKKV